MIYWLQSLATTNRMPQSRFAALLLLITSRVRSFPPSLIANKIHGHDQIHPNRVSSPGYLGMGETIRPLELWLETDPGLSVPRTLAALLEEKIDSPISRVIFEEGNTEEVSDVSALRWRRSADGDVLVDPSGGDVFGVSFLVTESEMYAAVPKILAVLESGKWVIISYHRRDWGAWMSALLETVGRTGRIALKVMDEGHIMEAALALQKGDHGVTLFGNADDEKERDDGPGEGRAGALILPFDTRMWRTGAMFVRLEI
uniref:Uncharacterized protein n=1 Tax=Octactis speculum TaxID=3111310 RepID=A0A7S2FDH9_9STRA